MSFCDVDKLIKYMYVCRYDVRLPKTYAVVLACYNYSQHVQVFRQRL